MNLEEKITAQEHSDEAVVSATVHAEAVEKARSSQIQEAIEQQREDMFEVFKQGMRELLTEGDEGTKTLLLQKIPLLCTDIIVIKKDIGWIRTMLVWGMSIFSVVGLPLLGWMLLQIIKNSSDIAILLSKI